MNRRCCCVSCWARRPSRSTFACCCGPGLRCPVFAPRRASVRQGRDELVHATRIKAALDSNERAMHCHHEKLVVIDDEVAFVGGIDPTDLGGDRFDTLEHPARRRMGWHDVASRLRGPAVADVARHFAQRWQAVTGEHVEVRPADVVSAGDVELQIVRTLPEKLYDLRREAQSRIIEAYVRALRSARHLVYLENQFLWSPEIVNILADKLRRPSSPGRTARPGGDLRVHRGEEGRALDQDDVPCARRLAFGLSRLGQPPAVGACRRRRAAARAHPRDPRDQPSGLWGAAYPRRARARRRRADRAQACRAAHAPRRPLGAYAQAPWPHDGPRAGRARVRRPRRPRLPCRRPQPAVGRRHHLSAHVGGLALSRRGAGHLQPPDRRLVDGRSHAHRARDRRVADGPRAAPA